MSASRSKPLPPSNRRPVIPAGSGNTRATSPTHQSPRNRMQNGMSTSARGAVKRTGTSSSAADEDEDARAEMAGVIEDLKEQLQRATDEAEEHKKQSLMIQSRLDDALREQTTLEDRVHEADELLEERSNEIAQLTRERKRMEGSYESEKAAMLKERENLLAQEESFRDVIKNIKGKLSPRSSRVDLAEHRLSQLNSSQEGISFAPPSALHRSDSNSNSRLLLQKDKIIENLKLDLAEAQIKVAQASSLGGARLQELEKEILELRMERSRLTEENGNYETLLEEFTVNGEFGRSQIMKQNSSLPSSSHGASSLADELGGEAFAEEDGAPEVTSAIRKLEQELKFSKEQNKALTLYVNNIIGRLLQHKELEDVLDRSPGLMSGAPIKPVEKPLPAAPRELASGQSILQRTRSLATGSLRRPRPMSFMGPPRTMSMTPQESIAEETKPSHRRTSFDHPPVASSLENSDSSSSGYTGEISTPSTSPQRRSSEGRPPVSTAAPPQSSISGNKLRTLRLVQENTIEDKSAKRGSWMGWLNQGKDKDAPSIFSGLSLGGNS